MRKVAYTVVVLLLTVRSGVVVADGPSAGPSPRQQVTSKEQAAAEQPASLEQKISPEQQAAAEKLGLPATITNSIGMKLVLIPAGEFMMGSSESPEELTRMYAKWKAKPKWFSGDQSQHRVRITKSFYMGMYEVTQKEYKAVVGGNPSTFTGSVRPVEGVSWEDAVEYCRKLSARENVTYRLPTEAEWEYACRADSTTQYSFDDSAAGLGRHAWLGDNSSSTTHPVGQKRPNAWGLYDMHGNVWELCADWYDEGHFKSGLVDDPTGPATGSFRVFRGGGWRDSAADCRTAVRLRILPVGFDSCLGFRIVAVPSASPVGGRR